MLRGSLHFRTLKVRILKVQTLWHCVKLKQRYLYLSLYLATGMKNVKSVTNIVAKDARSNPQLSGILMWT